MKGLIVLGPGGSGKTAICVALALHLREAGVNVGYFKPIGNVAGTKFKEDGDALLMQELLGLEVGMDKIVPIHTSPSYLSKYSSLADPVQKIKDSFQAVSANRDYVIVEGTTAPQTMMALGLDAPNLASVLGLKAIVVNRGENDYYLDEALLYLRYLESVGVKPSGVLFNNVPKQNIDKCKGVYTPLLEQAGFPVLGVIPKQRELVAPSAREVCSVLEGELLEGKQYLDRLVEEVMIAAMGPESALNYFHRSINKAVIAGGDRPLVSLAALETSTSLLILTGGIYPDMRVLTRAAEKKVPVLLVPYDTYTTSEKLHAVTKKIIASDATVIAQARRNFSEHCDLTKVAGLLGVPFPA